MGADSAVMFCKSVETMTFYFFGYISQIPNQLRSVITCEVCIQDAREDVYPQRLQQDWACIWIWATCKCFTKGVAFLNQSDSVKLLWRRTQLPAIYFCLVTSCSCLYFLMGCFPNSPVQCHLSLLRSGTVWHCRESNSLGNRRCGCPCVAVPGRHRVAQCNPVPHTFVSFPSSIMQITNNNRAFAGGKNHPCMGKFTSDWVGCLKTWKLDWGEQSRNCKLIRFAEAVLYEFSSFLWEEILSKWVWLLIWLWQLGS